MSKLSLRRGDPRLKPWATTRALQNGDIIALQNGDIVTDTEDAFLQDDNVIVQDDRVFAIPKDEGLVWFTEERLYVDVRLGNVSRAKSSRPLVCRRLERIRL